MKGSSLATVILVATITTIVTALVVNALLGDPNAQTVNVRYMDVVKPEVSEPDREMFNPIAVNPTVEVYVGQCKTDEIWDAVEQECVAQEPEGEETPTPPEQ